MNIQPYLFFEGRCEEAIAFYREAIGAEVIMMMRYGESPESGECSDGTTPPADKIMHASLQVGEAQLLLSDGMVSGTPEFKGITLSLTAADDAEARRLFDALADGGTVMQPLIETFFATSFGMTSDRFGVSWLVMAAKPM